MVNFQILTIFEKVLHKVYFKHIRHSEFQVAHRRKPWPICTILSYTRTSGQSYEDSGPWLETMAVPKLWIIFIGLCLIWTLFALENKNLVTFFSSQQGFSSQDTIQEFKLLIYFFM